MKRFFVRPNFGHWSVADSTTNKMVVGYHKKEYAETTANGLNEISREDEIDQMTQLLKTKEGYGHYINLKRKLNQ